MKKTKSTFTMLLVLAMLVLGIGYAAATNTLNINGTLGAKVDDSNFNVVFKTATAGEASVTSTTIEPVVTAAIDATDKQLATFTVKNFTHSDDTVTLQYVVENKSEELTASVDAEVKATFGNSEYFSVTASFAEASAVSTTEIAAGGTATLYVKVTCIKTPAADVADATTEGIVTLTATAVEA